MKSQRNCQDHKFIYLFYMKNDKLWGCNKTQARGSKLWDSDQEIYNRNQQKISFPGGPVVTNLLPSRCRLNPWVWKSPWRRKQQPTLVSLLENPMDRGARQVTVHGVARQTDTTWQLNNSRQAYFRGFVKVRFTTDFQALVIRMCFSSSNKEGTFLMGNLVTCLQVGRGKSESSSCICSFSCAFSSEQSVCQGDIF